MTLTEEVKQLVEEIGIRMENRLDISPLAARIYALLSISSYNGLSFEEIREAVNTTKSSASININVLTQLGYVAYFTKPGDRKRYFKIAKYYQLQSFETYLESLEKEIEIVEKINAYNKKHHPEKFKNEKSLGDISQDYLKKLQQLIKDTMEKISHLRKDDH